MTLEMMYALATGLGEAKNRQDVETALHLMHEDMILYSPAWGTVARGKEENRRALSRFFESFPDYNVSIHGHCGDGETFVGWGIVRMTMSPRAWLACGAKPNGARIETPVYIRMKFKAGKIAEEHFLCDLAQIASQSGLSIDTVYKNAFGRGIELDGAQ